MTGTSYDIVQIVVFLPRTTFWPERHLFMDDIPMGCKRSENFVFESRLLSYIEYIIVALTEVSLVSFSALHISDANC